MKTKMFFFLLLFIFSLWSCEKEEIVTVEEIAFSAVVLPVSSSAQEPQEIIVQITTGTPCYSIEVEKTVTGNLFEYNFILTEIETICIQATKKHDIPVIFDPSSAGTFTLRFLIDGELHETHEIVVTENSLVGTWQVLRFEDKIQNTVVSSPEAEEIVITFGSSNLEGTTERNRFEGEYQIPAKNEILCTEFLSTEAEETEFGKMFYEVMKIGQIQPLPFEVNENLLKINYEEGQYMILSRLQAGLVP